MNNTSICSECIFMFNCGTSAAARVFYKQNNHCDSFEREDFIDNPFVDYSEVVEHKNYLNWKVKEGLI